MIKASKAMRFLFLNASLVMWLSIWLSGFGVVHWLSYLVPSFFLFAAVSGICPGFIIARKIFGEN